MGRRGLTDKASYPHGIKGKHLRKLINGPYHFEQEIGMDLSSLDKNHTVKAIKNDMKL